MIQLLFGCYCSELKVHPQNWQKPKASVIQDWYIYYRFYDPLFKKEAKYKKGKLVMLKGMNQFKVVADRQKETQKLLYDELKKLKEKGFNPITGQLIEPLANISLIEPSMGFIRALNKAYQTIEASELTKRDLRGIIGLVTKAALQLRFNELPIGTVSRKHIKAILIQIEANLGSKSSHRFNKIRTYLMMLFKELIEQEATEINPTKEIIFSFIRQQE